MSKLTPKPFMSTLGEKPIISLFPGEAEMRNALFFNVPKIAPRFDKLVA